MNSLLSSLVTFELPDHPFGSFPILPAGMRVPRSGGRKDRVPPQWKTGTSRRWMAGKCLVRPLNARARFDSPSAQGCAPDAMRSPISAPLRRSQPDVSSHPGFAKRPGSLEFETLVSQRYP